MSERLPGTFPPPQLFEVISVNFKQSKDYDFTAAVSSLLGSLGVEPASLLPDTSALNRARKSATGLLVERSGLDRLLSYYCHVLEFEIDLLFRSNAFAKEQLAESKDFRFEKASIFFNIAASLTHLAQKSLELFSAASLKDAFNYLQKAASIFNSLAGHDTPLGLADLHRDTLMLLCKIMLAQAQEVAAHKAFVDQKTKKLLAKLYTGAASLYRECILSYNAGEAPRTTVDATWPVILNAKMKYMAVLAETLQSTEDLGAQHHGASIARLKVASDHCSEALSYLGKWLPSISRHLADLQNILDGVLVQQERDNSLIFHQPVPSRAELASIEKAVIVKVEKTEAASLLDELKLSKPGSLFRGIYPIRIYEDISRYSEEKAKLTRYMSSKAAECSYKADETLAKIDSRKGSEQAERQERLKVPEDIRQFVQEISGYTDFNSQLRSAMSLAAFKTIAGSIERMVELLEDDEQEHSRFKAANNGHQAPSWQSNSVFYSQIAVLRKANLTAEGKILALQKGFDWQWCAEVLDSGGAALDSHFTFRKSLDEADSPFSESIELEHRRLSSLQKELGDLLNGLKEHIKHDEIGEFLIASDFSRSSDRSDLFKQALSKHDAQCEKIEQTIMQLQRLCVDIDGKCSRRQATPSEEAKTTRSSSEAQNKIARFKSILPSIRDSLKEAAHLQTECEKLYSDVGMHLESRRKERGDALEKAHSANALKGREVLLGRLQGIDAKQTGGHCKNAAENAQDTRRQLMLRKLQDLSRK